MTNVMKKITLATSLATSALAIGLTKYGPTVAQYPAHVTAANPLGEGIIHTNGQFFPTFDKGWKWIKNQSWQYIGMGRNVTNGPIYTPQGIYTPNTPGTTGPVAGYNGNGDAIPNATTAVVPGPTMNADGSTSTAVGPLSKEELKKRAMKKLSAEELKALLEAKIKAEAEANKPENKPENTENKPSAEVAAHFEKVLAQKSDAKKASEFLEKLALTEEQKQKVFADWKNEEMEAAKDKTELVSALYKKCHKAGAAFSPEQEKLAKAFLKPTAEENNTPVSTGNKPMNRAQIKKWLDGQIEKDFSAASDQMKAKIVVQKLMPMAKDLNTNVTEAKLAEAWKSVVSSEQSTEELEALLVKKTNTNTPYDAPEDDYNTPYDTPYNTPTGTGSKATKADLTKVLLALIQKKKLSKDKVYKVLDNFKPSTLTKAQVKSIKSVEDLQKLKLLEKENAKPDVNNFDDDYDTDSGDDYPERSEDGSEDSHDGNYNTPTYSDSDKKLVSESVLSTLLAHIANVAKNKKDAKTIFKEFGNVKEHGVDGGYAVKNKFVTKAAYEKLMKIKDVYALYAEVKKLAAAAKTNDSGNYSTPTNAVTEKKQKQLLIAEIMERLMETDVDATQLGNALSKYLLTDLRSLKSIKSDDELIEEIFGVPATDDEVNAFVRHLKSVFGTQKKLDDELKKKGFTFAYLKKALKNSSGDELKVAKKMANTPTAAKLLLQNLINSQKQ